MHHTSTLHTLQPTPVSPARTNILFSAIAVLAGFSKKLVAQRTSKKNSEADNLVNNYIKNDPALEESILGATPLCHPELVYPEHSRREACHPELVEGSQRWFKQYTQEKIDGQVIHFGKWCVMVHAEKNLTNHSPVYDNSILRQTVMTQDSFSAPAQKSITNISANSNS